MAAASGAEVGDTQTNGAQANGAQASHSTERRGIWAETRRLLSGCGSLLRHSGVRLGWLILLTQLLILGVAFPVFGWLFREAMRANGMHGLDLGHLTLGAGIPITLALIALIATIAFWFLSMQFTALVVLLRWSERGITARAFFRELGRVARKLVRPSSLPLVAYLFVLLPLTGFGFTSAMVRGVAIPPFISGELFKTTVGAIAFTAFLLVLAFLNLRLAATVPVFVLTEATGRQAMRASWRMTRGFRGTLPIIFAGVIVFACGALASLLLTLVAVVPTAISDAIAPDASVVVAAYSLGVAQVAGFFITGGLTAAIAAILITLIRGSDQTLPKPNERAEGHATGPDRTSRRAGLGIIAASLAVAVVFGTASIGTFETLARSPETLVLAHRGFSEGGVENTISGLDAAAKAGADLVEMDVMQTKDGEFIAMHDATLGRLADQPDAVKDLTLAELTDITVRDQQGHSDTIPSFRDYVSHAEEIGMPLLIEIKLGGADTDDHVERLIAELEELGVLNNHIYHSLDPASVSTLKHLRPDLTVGYTMAFAGGDIPDTPADFIVVEEWTATSEMQEAATRAGLGFKVWTVNEVAGMREHLRRSTDGIISDRPDQVLAARVEMQEESGLADVLLDALTRFVKIP